MSKRGWGPRKDLGGKNRLGVLEGGTGQQSSAQGSRLFLGARLSEGASGVDEGAGPRTGKEGVGWGLSAARCVGGDEELTLREGERGAPGYVRRHSRAVRRPG